MNLTYAGEHVDVMTIDHTQVLGVFVTQGLRPGSGEMTRFVIVLRVGARFPNDYNQGLI